MRVRLILLCAASAIALTSCGLLASEMRSLGVGDNFVANYDASRLAIQAIEADYLPEDDEYYAGRAAAARILAQYELYENETANDYVNLLGQSLALASSRPIIYAGYRFAILDTDEINGLATPGGHVFVTRGLLRLGQSEDEVAAILAHEISHIAERHGAEAIMETRGRNIALRAEALTYQLAAVGLDDSGIARATGVLEERSQAVIAKLVGDGYSVESEMEADSGAIQILLKLGYDPYALVRVLERLEMSYETLGRSAGGFARTHPNPRRRVREIERRLVNYGGGVAVNREVADRRYRAALSGI
ncbi:MAG: M48 family metalloprotease [Spirochaetales bacterium]